jgi:hypothetical protein
MSRQFEATRICLAVLEVVQSREMRMGDVDVDFHRRGEARVDDGRTGRRARDADVGRAMR